MHVVDELHRPRFAEDLYIQRVAVLRGLAGDVLSVADVGEPVGRPAELGEPVGSASPDRLVRIGAVRSDEPDRPGAGKVALECDASVVRGPARVYVVAGAVEEDTRVGRAVDLDREDGRRR